jgi:hypothetical protein
MTYPEIKESLTNILKWLEGNDDPNWDAQIEVGEECRSEMERMARPNYRQRTTGSPGHDPKLDRAIPHVRAMLSSMRSRKRAAAVEHGKAAVIAM